MSPPLVSTKVFFLEVATSRGTLGIEPIFLTKWEAYEVVSALALLLNKAWKVSLVDKEG